MGGREGIRGYQIQTLICVLDSLDIANQWSNVAIEPIDDSEKVDIAWKYSDRKRVVQVKSSQNQINIPDVNSWASELQKSTVADEYELRLLGPCSAEVAKSVPVGLVQVAKPEPENVPYLLERGAHRLNLFLHSKGLSLPPTVLEIVIGALSNRLLTDAVQGRTWTRVDMENLLCGWSTEILTSELPISDIPLPLPQNAFFCGRDELLAKIRNDFEASDRESTFGVQVLSGLGGVGKSQVALEYAYRFRKEYSHVFFVDADSLRSITNGLAAYAMQLGIPVGNHSDQKSLSDAMKQWLASNNRWLLLLDNADNPECTSEFMIQRETCHTLLTSRASVFDMLGVGSPHVVRPLSAEESESFLLARTGRKNAEGQERFAANRIGLELDGLPLALEQAGAYIASRQMPFSTYLSAFTARRLQILERSKPVTGAYQNTVATTWSLNIEAVNEESKASSDLLRWCAFFHSNQIPLDVIVVGASDLSTAISETVDGLFEDHDLTRIDELLFPLTRLSLITRFPNETISIHRLVQEVVKGEMDAKSVSEHRLQLTKTLLRFFPSVSFEVWFQCERLLSHAVTVLGDSTEEELLCEEAGTLLYRCAHYLEETGDYHLALSIYSKAVEVREKILGAAHADLGMTINNLALTMHRLGRYKEAEEQYRRALAIRRTARGERHPDVAQTYSNLGLTLVALGEFREAEEYYQAAESILVEAGENHLQTLATCLNNRAGLLHNRGFTVEAENVMRKVVEIHRSQHGESHPSYAFSLKNLAKMLFDSGSVDEAMKSLCVAMEVESHTIGIHHPTYGHSLNFMGAILVEKKMYADAVSAFRNAGDVFFSANGHGDPGLCLVYVNLASLYTESCEFENASLYHMKAIQHNEAYNGTEHLETATAKSNAAYFYLRVGDVDSARHLYESALHIRVKVLGREHHDVATLLGNLGMIAGRVGNPVEADVKYCEAFGISQRLGFPKWSNTCNLILNFLSYLERRGNKEMREMIFSCLDATCVATNRST